MKFANTQYGFDYGAASITRAMSDEKKGWVILIVDTPKQSIQVYVTKTGKVRVHDTNGEWTKP